MERYASQLRVKALGGAAGQERLSRSQAVVVGLGATGGALADALVRAGVGRVRLIDRDVVELQNLHRQLLFDETDAASGLPKAEAAAARLARINSQVVLEPRIADLGPDNARELLAGADLVLDGTDNFATRLVLNDACLAAGQPWVYAGVVGTSVHGFPILPGRTACFRCYLPEVPPPGAAETCESAGVLGPAVLVGAGFAAAEGLKLLLGGEPAEGLLVVDVWTREARRLRLPRDPDCPACAGRYEHLAAPGQRELTLCGRDAVMLRAPGRTAPDLGALAERLAGLGRLEARGRHLLRFQPGEDDGHTLTVFADGRTIVGGTQDPVRARALYARWLGS